MKSPLTTLRIIGRKFLKSSGQKPAKSLSNLPIERKWWMGEDLLPIKSLLIIR
ncbi:hypothetical protein LWM68_28715 [Niabella sp. W65]|nr:hypothetical protein [Niabella sp. W65]MCH7366403.1 hypothetical protein [Niabella sp. W65]ULT42120.1 hypothetical protein KRR40_00165 [Niabella sp. I65]